MQPQQHYQHYHHHRHHLTIPQTPLHSTIASTAITTSINTTRAFTSTSLLSMANSNSASVPPPEDPYTAFLNRANQSYSAPLSPSAGGASGTFSTPSHLRSITSPPADPHPPQPIHTLIAHPETPYYVSDVDEPFIPVTFPLLPGGIKQSVARFLGIENLEVNSDAPEIIVEMSTKEWDPRGDYKSVVKAVGESVQGGEAGVTVLRVEGSGARVEYFVLGVEQKEEEEGEGEEQEGKIGRIVGVRANAVES
ncbi:hypothetical protein BDZ91DRAFT_725849 [Kalaharituber pfeilii]|nr:hypothetical protein BDZ91DRAFT_725849 [Kalaharituber pfeilii]